jgi:hypothetical protein
VPDCGVISFGTTLRLGRYCKKTILKETSRFVTLNTQEILNHQRTDMIKFSKDMIDIKYACSNLQRCL